MNDLYEDFDIEEDDLEEFPEEDEEEFEDLMEEFGAGEDDEGIEGAEDVERRRRRRRRRRSSYKSRGVGAAGSGRSFRPRLEKSYATQAQLQAASARLDKKISVNGQAIKKVNGRVNDLGKRHARDVTALRGRLDNHADAIKKERAARSKADEKLRKDLQMAMMLPMMMQPTPLTVTAALATSSGFEEGTKLATVKDDTLSMMLPLMFMGGGEGGDNSMMMLALAMAMSGKD